MSERQDHVPMRHKDKVTVLYERHPPQDQADPTGHVLVFPGTVLFVAVRFNTRTSTHRTFVIISWVLVGLSLVETLMVSVNKSCPGNAQELIKFSRARSMTLQIYAS